MIRYSLKCSADHSFDSWFQSASAYETLAGAGHVACPVCGVTKVEKALMAPRVAQSEVALSVPQTEMEKAMAELRRKVEENSEYVGVNFVAEARKMHEGAVPERSIYGEARPEEAMRLLQDGVPVAPLPFMPARKTN
ncbi:DUF1178 family protein [bacterium]|nr:DUF1178 family protein [bacterium]